MSALIHFPSVPCAVCFDSKVPTFNHRNHLFCRLPTGSILGCMIRAYKHNGLGSQWYAWVYSRLQNVAFNSTKARPEKTRLKEP